MKRVDFCRARCWGLAPREAAGPLNGAEMICATQGGTWHPNGFPTFPQPTCTASS